MRVDNVTEKGATESYQSRRVIQSLIFASTFVTAVQAGTCLGPSVLAYETSDSASETVTKAVVSLKESIGDTTASFKSLENIGDIITEGKGVGGSLSYTGAKLERGYVADEDTTIYNPGLTLLTESEKNRLVTAVIANRKENMLQNTWSEGNERAYSFLKEKLDPWHVVELKSYLTIAPFIGGTLYLGSFAVQQNKREWFPPAYLLSAGIFFLPIVLLIVKGP